MKLLVWAVLIGISLTGILLNILKKYVAVDSGELNLKSLFKLKTWFRLLLNPIAILSLSFSFAVWGVHIWAFSMEDANKIVITTTALAIPSLLINIYFNNRFFQEVITKTQYLGLGLCLVGMTVVTVGMWIFAGGLK